MKENNRKQTFLFLSFLIFIGAIGIIGFRVDGDVMWHFKTGEFIVNNGYVPKHDVFSWQEGLNWMCHEWLYDVILYLLYSNFGEMAARCLLMVAYSVPIGFSLFYNKNKIKYPVLYYLFCGFIVAFWASSNCARPSEFSIGIMLLLMHLLLIDHKYKYPISFILSVLCTNIHGGSIAQLIIIPVLFIISDVVCNFTTGENVNKDLKSHIITTILIIAGTLLNPYGVSIYKYTLNIFMDAKYINAHIQEWKPTVINLYMAVFIIGFVLCMGANQKFREFEKNTLRKFIVICGFMCQGMAILRMYFNASCIILVFGYEYFEEFIDYMFSKINENFKFNFDFKSNKIFNRISENTVGLIKDSLMLCYGGIALAVIGTNIMNAGSNQTFLELVDSEKTTFKEIADCIKENNITGRIYNDYGDGGLLIIHDIKTFLDPRCDPFLEAFSDNNSMYDYCVAQDAVDTTRYEAWEKLNEKYNFEYCIFNKKVPTSMEASHRLKEDGHKALVENEKYVLIELNKESK